MSKGKRIFSFLFIRDYDEFLSFLCGLGFGLLIFMIYMFCGLFYIIFTAINLSKFAVAVSIKDIMENPQ